MMIHTKSIWTITLLTMSGVAGTHAASAAPSLPTPKSITVDGALSKAKAAESIHAARLYYGFWDTGNPALARAALSKDFRDNTLPEGRPQGPEGPLFASRNFRAAVPDLRCAVEDLLVTGDKVTARLSFWGTFTGKFPGHPATGKPIKFWAIDILHIRHGKIFEDWHLEDNLTLLTQLGAVKKS